MNSVDKLCIQLHTSEVSEAHPTQIPNSQFRTTWLCQRHNFRDLMLFVQPHPTQPHLSYGPAHLSFLLLHLHRLFGQLRSQVGDRVRLRVFNWVSVSEKAEFRVSVRKDKTIKALLNTAENYITSNWGNSSIKITLLPIT